MGNAITNYNFDTNGKFVSGIAMTGTSEYSKIIGFYVSDFGQTSEYLYQARVEDSILNTDVPNSDLNVFFPPGFFLSGIEHYNKSTKGSMDNEEQVHYIITDGYSKLVGYIHYQKHLMWGPAPETVSDSNKFSCTTGEYLTNQIYKSDIADAVRTVTHEYKCSTGEPRPIPSSNVGAMGPIGPRGWQGVPGAIGFGGSQGLQGGKGATGIQGSIGLRGDRGLIGNQGLMGMPGPQGASGEKGAIGQTGQRGPLGTTGPVGVRGFQGGVGIAGIRGNTGPKGATGPQGVKGAAFENKRVKQQLHLTSILLFLIIVYVVVWVSSFGAVLGTTGGIVGDSVTGGGDMFNNMIANSGEMAGGVVSGAGDMVGGMISGAGRMLGGAIGGTTDMIGGAIGGTSGIIGGAIGGTSQAVGGAVDGVVGGSIW
jgi:hypothetical protein